MFESSYRLEDDLNFAFRFGTENKDIKVETLSRFTLDFIEALNSINDIVNPGHWVEYRVGRSEDGSFWLSIRGYFEGKNNLFQGVPRDLVIGVMAAFIYGALDNDEVNIVINDDSYIVQQGDDRYILPKNPEDAGVENKVSPKVKKHVARAFSHLEADESISDLQIYDEILGGRKLLDLRRSDFKQLSELTDTAPKERSVLMEMVLVIFRPVMFESNTPWTFVHDGLRITAHMRDPVFYLSVSRGDRPIRAGDNIECTVEVIQIRDERTGVWMNKRYSIIRVNRYNTSGRFDID